MAQETSSFSGPSTPEAFIADRMRFWHAVTRFITMGSIGIVLLLIILRWWLV